MSNYKPGDLLKTVIRLNGTLHSTSLIDDDLVKKTPNPSVFTVVETNLKRKSNSNKGRDYLKLLDCEGDIVYIPEFWVNNHMKVIK